MKHDLLVEKVKHSPLNAYIVNWYVDFLARRQRVVCKGVMGKWKVVNKGTIHGSVSGPYLFKLFLNDLELDEHNEISLTKYGDGSTILVIFSKNLQDKSDTALSKFMDWTEIDGMHRNSSKFKELILPKKGNLAVYPMLYNIKQYTTIPILGITMRGNCKFSEHVKTKLFEENKCLFIIRSLRKEGYTQEKVDIFFNAIVLSKI